MTGATRQLARRGFALVAVLWVVIIVAIMLLGVRRNSWANSAAARNELGAVQARWLARAGVEQAMAVLEDDTLDADGSTDLWYDSETDFHNFALVGGSFTVSAPAEEGEALTVRFGLVDHAGLVNVNAADANQLAALDDGLLLDETQVDSILDWIDSNDDIRPGGAEAGYYNRLTYPYEIRNGRIPTLPELRLVKGIDDETFYGEDADQDGVLDSSEDDGDASFPPDDADGQLRVGLSGLCTVYSYDQNTDATGQPRINMSNADRTTMVQQLNFTDALADAVVRQRRGRRLRSVTDLVGIRGESSASGGQSGGSAASAGGTTGSSAGATGGTSGSSSSGQGGGTVNEITLAWVAQNFDRITVARGATTRGRINVNTASKETLLTLPSLSAESAEAIVARRISAKGAYTSVGQLLGDPLTEPEFRAVAERCTVRSNVFEVRSAGVTDLGIRHEIRAVIDRGTTPIAILYWYESE